MGFSDAYQILLSNIGDINEIMGRYLTQDYRTRIVVRATRHYTSILEMLKLPQVQDYRTWKSAVLEKFAKSGSYIGTTTQMILAEISDLEIGDVPFFWFNMRDRRLHHRNGIISDLRPEAFNSTQRDFYCNIKEDEHDVLIDCLTAFLAEN